MTMAKKIYVLIACEESQATCLAFRSRGHVAYSCDIQRCSGGHPEWHIVGDALEVLNGRCSFVTEDGQVHTLLDRWDLIIAHPPCTYLTHAGGRYLFANHMLQVDRAFRCMGARWFFLAVWYSSCSHICIENPSPMYFACLPPYTQIVQPFEFGDQATKRTCLWLRGLPNLRPTCNQPRPKSEKRVYPDGVVRYIDWTCRRRGGKARSKTFHGIAEAFAIQFGGFVSRGNFQTQLIFD